MNPHNPEVWMRGCMYGKHDKTKNMVMSRDQSAGQIHSIKTDNNSFGKVEELKKFGNKLHK
jgi:hypothetical protein